MNANPSMRNLPPSPKLASRSPEASSRATAKASPEKVVPATTIFTVLPLLSFWSVTTEAWSSSVLLEKLVGVKSTIALPAMPKLLSSTPPLVNRATRKSLPEPWPAVPTTTMLPSDCEADPRGRGHSSPGRSRPSRRSQNCHPGSHRSCSEPAGTPTRAPNSDAPGRPASHPSAPLSRLQSRRRCYRLTDPRSSGRPRLKSGPSHWVGDCNDRLGRAGLSRHSRRSCPRPCSSQARPGRPSRCGPSAPERDRRPGKNR